MNADGLNLDGVEKRFADFHLGPISASLRPGQAYGLLGPNGAGKTTLLNLIAIQLRLSGGTMSFSGTRIAWGDPGWKSRFSYIREHPAFYDELPVAATLALAARLYDRWDGRFANELLQRFGIDRRKAVGRLSKGTRVKVGIILALAHHADLLMLDEPTAGLDPTARLELQTILRELKSERPHVVLVLSSHIFEDIERVADEVIIVRRGLIVFQEALPALAALPLFRLPDTPAVRDDDDIRLSWRRDGYVWVVPTTAEAVRVRAIPGCESVPGGASLSAVYHGTEQLCEAGKPGR